MIIKSIGGISCLTGMVASMLAGTASIALPQYDKQTAKSGIIAEANDMEESPKLGSATAHVQCSMELYRLLSNSDFHLDRIGYFNIIDSYLSGNATLLQDLLGTIEYDAKVGAFNNANAQYGKLVNGYLVSGEYRTLMLELESQLKRISVMSVDNAEYDKLQAEIDSLWGKISMLAGQFNSQISLAEGVVMVAIDDIITVIYDNIAQTDVAKAAQPNQINNSTVQPVVVLTAEQKSLIIELNMLRLQLGLIDSCYSNLVVGTAQTS